MSEQRPERQTITEMMILADRARERYELFVEELIREIRRVESGRTCPGMRTGFGTQGAPASWSSLNMGQSWTSSFFCPHCGARIKEEGYHEPSD